jgi:hypothetical protein
MRSTPGGLGGLAAALLLAALPGCRPAAPPKAWPPDQQKAVNLAAGLLARSKAGWGEPDAVTRQPQGSQWVKGPPEATFALTYPTPADEVKVLGPRVVVVNTESGEAVFLPRD